jgi:eukaryotic-like serine/threonine-protein kinase
MVLPLIKPDRIGRYEIVSVIGRGGMGTVYLATDARIGRSVAIKILSSSFSIDSELLARFYREAKSTGSLQHQNIVTVYELGDQDGFPYLVMEYLEGESLDSAITARKALSICEKLDILIQVCGGLNYAHKRGIVHRDIKPANIMITSSGTAKIVDFGIAQVESSRLTRTGMVFGSIHYMSPEQLSDTIEVDSRTDLYSAGVVLFQLLTGVLPFEGRDTASTLLKVIHDPPPRLGKFLDDCPAELESIVQKALAKNRDERYVSAEDFAFDLSRLQQQLSHEMLAQYLAEAAGAIEQQEFDQAKRLIMQVLRVDSRNTQAKELLRDVLWNIEVQKRKLQVKRLHLQAKGAFENQQFDVALKWVNEGLELDTRNPELHSLRAAILKQEETAEFAASLNRAEMACDRGDQTSLLAIEETHSIQPNDPRVGALGTPIADEIEGGKRREQAAEASRQFALAGNTVEKAIAEARELSLSQENQRALDILEKIQLAGVPMDLQNQLQGLKQEIQKQLASSDTELISQAPTRALDQDSRAHDARPSETTLPPRDQAANEVLSTASYPQPPQVAVPRGVERGDPGQLIEFLPERPSFWSHKVWIGAAAAVAALWIGWLIVAPKSPNYGSQVTYVQINAEPWGTVKEIVTSEGKSLSRPDEPTPARLSLPRGRYTVTMSGPTGETKQLQLEVPGREGNSYFVLFSKPDIDRMLSDR